MNWYNVKSNWILEGISANEQNFDEVLQAENAFKAVQAHTKKVTYGKDRPKVGGLHSISKDDLRGVTVDKLHEYKGIRTSFQKVNQYYENNELRA